MNGTNTPVESIVFSGTSISDTRIDKTVNYPVQKCHIKVPAAQLVKKQYNGLEQTSSA